MKSGMKFWFLIVSFSAILNLESSQRLKPEYIIRKAHFASDYCLILAKSVDGIIVHLDTFYYKLGIVNTTYTLLNNNKLYFLREQVEYDPNANHNNDYCLDIYDIKNDSLVLSKFIKFSKGGQWFNRNKGYIDGDSFCLGCSNYNDTVNTIYRVGLENITIEKIDLLYKLCYSEK